MVLSEIIFLTKEAECLCLIIKDSIILKLIIWKKRWGRRRELLREEFNIRKISLNLFKIISNKMRSQRITKPMSQLILEKL
jgi:hypothetical protein